jgi:hypothetical protein
MKGGNRLPHGFFWEKIDGRTKEVGAWRRVSWCTFLSRPALTLSQMPPLFIFSHQQYLLTSLFICFIVVGGEGV